MSSIDRERNDFKVSPGLINSLGQPRDEAMLHIERSLDRLSHSEEAYTRGLLFNLGRLLTTGSGDAHALPKEELFARLQPKYTAEQIARVFDQLQSKGLIISNDGLVKLSSGVLSKLIHAKIQAETASQQKIEAFITNRYDYYLEKKQLLSEQDMIYITPFMGDVVLNRGQQDFVNESQRAIKKQKRRGALVLASVIGILSVLSLVAVVFAIRAQNASARASVEAQRAKIEESKAKAKEWEAKIEAANARKAELAAADARDSLKITVEELKVANDQIHGLLSKVTDESNAAKLAQKYAEEQRLVATTRALEIEKLNKDLNLYAEDKEREARAARDAEAEAKEARTISDELRNILLSRIVAKRSLSMKEEDTDLKAYTAMLAYHINDHTNNGDVLHPDIFKAIYYAAQNQDPSSVVPSVDLANGAIGSLQCDNPESSLTVASDGSVIQFSVDPNSGAITNVNRILHLRLDPVRFVFPQTSSPGASGTAFVLGAFNYILEVALPSSGGISSTEIRRFALPNKQVVKQAVRISDQQLMIQTADGALYEFDCDSGILHSVLNTTDQAVAWTALSNLGLVCYANAQEELILTDLKRSARVVYANAKKQVAQMQLKQYESAIYLALAYADGEIEVFLSNKEDFLSAYQNQRHGKSYYQIQSLRSSVHTGYIPMLEFADSRRLLAVCSYDGTVSVWDLKEWETRSGDYQPLILDDHDDWVTSCTFLPGDKSLLSGSKLGTVKFWSFDPAVYARDLCNDITRSPNDEEWREYIGDELKDFKEAVCRGK